MSYKYKLFVFLVLFFFVAQSAFLESPISPVDQINSENIQMAASFDNNYSEIGAFSSSVPFRFGDTQMSFIGSVRWDVVGPSLMVDNSTTSNSDLKLLIIRGFTASHLMSIPDSRTLCDSNFAPFLFLEGQGWRCDFDNDGCVEYENSFNSRYTAYANFIFRNISVVVPVDSTSVSVPSNIIEEMKSSSGLENLTVETYGNLTLIYHLNNRKLGADGCYNSFFYVTLNVPFSANRSFQVAGENRLFFVERPILRDQWSKNNRFDVIVLSQAPIYHAAFVQTNTSMKNFSIYEFEVIQTEYGLRKLITTKNNLSVAAGTDTDYKEFLNLSTPIPLEQHNNSFHYIYRFNNSFSADDDLNVSFVVDDVFNRESLYEEQIQKKSAPALLLFPQGTEKMNTLLLSSSLVGLLFLVPFLRYKSRSDLP